MKKNILYVVCAMIVLAVLQSSLISAAVYGVNLSDAGASSVQYENSQFAAQELKYDPYPVNPGDWFNLWVEVQNIGQQDAPNASFELLPDYPFYSNDSLVRDYGTIPGVSSAYKDKIRSGDIALHLNYVVIKYRVKVADNAPEGENTLRFKAITDKRYSNGPVYNLPIEVAKTKTDFGIVMQDSTSTGYSFAIANIGSNDASAVIVSINPQDNVRVTGSSSSIVGTLSKGDFTTVSFNIIPNRNADKFNMNVSYTDKAGIRNSIEKAVELFSANINATATDRNFSQFGAGSARARSAATPANYYAYAVIIVAVAALVGILIFFIHRRLKRKNK